MNNNGDSGIEVVATNETKASGTISYTLAAEIETTMSAAQLAEFAPGRVAEEGDHAVRHGGSRQRNRDDRHEDSRARAPTPIPDSPVWTKVAPTIPTPACRPMA